MEPIGKGREEGWVRERKEDKLFGVKEREDMRDTGKEGMGIREQTERKRGAKRDWDISIV